LDVVVGIPSAAVAAPIVAGLAAIKKVEDGDEAFLTQARLINKEETFRMIKLRSMVRHAERHDSLAVSEGKNHYDDPRATRLGSFMRRYHLDELPQIFQVVLGQMTLVGNRPILPKYAEHLSKRWSKERFQKWICDYGKGRKGITGIYQVFGPQKRHDESRFHMDTLYTRCASLGLDLYILWRTLRREIGV
jgi:lipopolysaccharide/colanic/teichoic acid biosynthesis glycosyltransferase